MTRVLLVFVFAWSAGLPQSWIQTLDGGAGENDIVRALILDDTGNAIVTGVMEGGANSVAGTAKFGLDGRLRFLTVYDPYPGFDQMGSGVTRDSSGCIYVAAPSRDTDTVWCFATICYGPDGAERWVARYSRPEHYSDVPYAVAAFASGGCVVTGRGGANSASDDIVTVCYSPDGRQRWVAWRNGGEDANDQAFAVAVDGQGCSYVCGYTTEPSSFQRERATIIKYDTLGNEIWSYTFHPVGPNDHSAWYDIAIDPIGSVYLTGYVGPVSTRFLTMKLSPQGESLWSKEYYRGRAKQIALDRTGSVYVTGTDDQSDSTPDIVMLKSDTTGALKWAARYDGPDQMQDWAHGLALGADGSVYVSGSSQSAQFGSECVIIKYAATGETAWTARIHGDGPYGTVGNVVCVDNDDNVIVAGSINKATTGNDYLIAKYPPTGPGVSENSPPPVVSLPILSISPTVASRQCRLTVSVGEHQTSLSIADITGRTVRGILVPSGRAGDRVAVTWDTRDDHGQLVPNGVYFVTLESASVRSSCKVIVQRQ